MKQRKNVIHDTAQVITSKTSLRQTIYVKIREVKGLTMNKICVEASKQSIVKYTKKDKEILITASTGSNYKVRTKEEHQK